jgi:hypothetical protein
MGGTVWDLELPNDPGYIMGRLQVLAQEKVRGIKREMETYGDNT